MNDAVKLPVNRASLHPPLLLPLWKFHPTILLDEDEDEIVRKVSGSGAVFLVPPLSLWVGILNLSYFPETISENVNYENFQFANCFSIIIKSSSTRCPVLVLGVCGSFRAPPLPLYETLHRTAILAERGSKSFLGRTAQKVGRKGRRSFIRFLIEFRPLI